MERIEAKVRAKLAEEVKPRKSLRVKRRGRKESALLKASGDESKRFK